MYFSTDGTTKNVMAGSPMKALTERNTSSTSRKVLLKYNIKTRPAMSDPKKLYFDYASCAKISMSEIDLLSPYLKMQ